MFNEAKLKSVAAVSLPTPSNISLLWNAGSVLGVCLSMQILTGLLLSLHYSGSADLAFFSITHIDTNVLGGWALRAAHANGASFMLGVTFLHIGRGLYYKSYLLNKVTWSIGVVLLVLTMATAFLGYVLPWGQMSFWGATVITNLLSTVPYIGSTLVNWLWGGFAIGGPTLSRFYSFHFILPFVILLFTMGHLLSLHTGGSSNPISADGNPDKISFYPFFYVKDLMLFLVLFLFWAVMVLLFPLMLADASNFIPANPLSTPTHIQPEWYFLFAYAILRSVPNKAGGALALLLSVVVLFPVILARRTYATRAYRAVTWVLAYCFILLTWIGMRPVEEPFILVGQTLSVLYFFFFLSLLFL